jgi:Fur family ferric uptake transcriptional regulator/Fur family peroxide stress response transcriptional regulator
MSCNCADRLREHGLKATIQRLAILEAIDHAGHIDIDELYKTVSQQHPSFSLSTVYKNIEGMQEAGLLIEVPVAGSRSKYEIAKEDHIHLICQHCGKIMDKPITDDIIAVIGKMSSVNGFEHQNSSINLYGICDACK